MSAWFEVEDERNSNVYVSGLPEDITIEEFKEFMTKVGVIAYDPVYRKPKVKLYAKEDGTYKGDGLCCYIKVLRRVFSVPRNVLGFLHCNKLV